MVNFNNSVEEKREDENDLLTNSFQNSCVKSYGTIDNELSESSFYEEFSISTKSYRSFNRLFNTSISISMYEKASYDQKAHTILAGWNVSNLIQGIGILGIPYATRQGGWAGVAVNFLVALITCHTGKLLIECMYGTSKKSGIKRRLRTSYPEIGEAVLGQNGLIIVTIFQNVEMFAATIMYIILLGKGLSNLFRTTTPDLGLEEWAAISCAFVLPTLFITKLSIVSWFSMVSVFSLMAAIFVIISFTFTNIPKWNISNIPEFDVQTFPVGFGIIVFSYCGHPVFPSIEGSMEKPQQYNAMMNCVFFIAAIVKACLGLFMVLRFGADTKQVAIMNLVGHSFFGKLSSVLIVVNVFLAVPLLMFVVNHSFDEALIPYFPRMDRDSKYYWVWLLISRPLLVGIALVTAVMVPFFGLIMGVIGSLTGTFLSFLFPCYFYLRLRWEELGKLDVLVNVAIILFGFIAGFSGLLLSLKALILKLL